MTTSFLYIGPFYLKSPPPPTDEVSKILTPKKKDQSADTKHTSEICKFPLTPQKNRRDQRMPTGLTPQKRLWGQPSEKIIRRGGGGVWTLNGMAHSISVHWSLVSKHCLHICTC